MTVNSTVVAVVLTAVVLFLANTAVVNRTSVSLQKAMGQLAASVGSGSDGSAVQADLEELREKMTAFHGSQELAIGQRKSLDELVAVINKTNTAGVAGENSTAAKVEHAQTYSKAEMERISSLLGDLQLGFSHYKDWATATEQQLLGAVGNVAQSVDRWKGTARAAGNSAAMGSMYSDATMQHHANVAAIRRDLPMVLPSVRLLIGILSGPGNAARRHEVRSTWGTYYKRSLGLSRQWSLWFLISIPANEEQAKALRQEKEEYGDIMLLSYLTEDYHLIGAKVVEFFHAASLFPQVQFAMKADDDSFVRVDRLLAQLDDHRDGNLFLGCNMAGSAPVRNPANKRYYATPSEYSPSVYPPYASGGGYVLSMDVVRGFDGVGQAAGYDPFRFEDVNTGMLIDIAGLKVKPKSGTGFYCFGPPKKATNSSGLQKDWVLYHYVGLQKRWTMDMLLEAAKKDALATIFQKKLRIQTHAVQAQWSVKEIELFSEEDCKATHSLAKQFGIGALAKNVKDNKATTWDNTFFEASSNQGDARLAFDGAMATAWTSAAHWRSTKHSVMLKFGVHSVPFDTIKCVRVHQDPAKGAAESLDVFFWDDEDAQWHLAFEDVRPSAASTSFAGADAFVLDAATRPSALRRR